MIRDLLDQGRASRRACRDDDGPARAVFVRASQLSAAAVAADCLAPWHGPGARQGRGVSSCVMGGDGAEQRGNPEPADYVRFHPRAIVGVQSHQTEPTAGTALKPTPPAAATNGEPFFPRCSVTGCAIRLRCDGLSRVDRYCFCTFCLVCCFVLDFPVCRAHPQGVSFLGFTAPPPARPAPRSLRVGRRHAADRVAGER